VTDAVLDKPAEKEVTAEDLLKVKGLSEETRQTIMKEIAAVRHDK
jgi:hypothetical protein